MDATTDAKTLADRHAFTRPRRGRRRWCAACGRYVADAPLPNQAFAYFVRSPHAFARIVSIDASGATNTPGVIAVLTAKDMEGVGNISRHPPIAGRNGGKLIISHRPALAGERVMHIGEAVAMVVAELRADRARCQRIRPCRI